MECPYCKSNNLILIENTYTSSYGNKYTCNKCSEYFYYIGLEGISV